MSKDDSAPAFPSERFGYIGMSLRDYFAGQALAAHAMRRSGGHECLKSGEAYRIAVDCYAIADAMLAEREAADDGE